MFAALCGMLLALSCGRRSDGNARGPYGEQSEADNPVLATVGGRRITLRDFQAELDRRSRANPQAYASEEQRQKLLREMVRFEVMLARAKAAGYDGKPEVRAQLNQLIVTRFQEDQLAKEAAAAPTEAEAREFYEQHQQRFSVPPAARFAVIYFKCGARATGEKREEIKRKAEAVLSEARATDAAGFGRLAAQNSEDQSTRYVGGDMGWVQQDDASPRWDAAVLNAAFALSEPGTFAPLVETPRGFYVVRLLEKKPGGVRAFEQVKDAISYELAQQKRYQQQRDLFEEMERGLKVNLNPEASQLISPAEHTAQSKPPPLPSS